MAINKLIIVATTHFSGGAEIYIRKLALAMEEIGCEVRLGGMLKVWPSNLKNDQLTLGPKWGLRTLVSGLFRSPREMRAFRIYAKEHSGATFNFHFKREQILFSRLAAQKGRVVWTEHGTYPIGLFGHLIRPFYQYASRYASETVCVSEFSRDSITRNAPSMRLPTIIDSPVDVDEYTPGSNIVRNTPPVALVIGRLEPTKRPLLAIEASLSAGCRVLVAGTGRLETDLRAKYKDNGLVEFVGHTTDTLSLYRSANIHIFASNGIGEGFPTVLLESAACALPTVAPADCGFEEYIKEAGGLVAEANTKALASAISKCLADSGERSSKARKWAMSRQKSEWVRAYNDVFFCANPRASN